MSLWDINELRVEVERLRRVVDAAVALEDAVASFDGVELQNTVLIPEAAYDKFLDAVLDFKGGGDNGPS